MKFRPIINRIFRGWKDLYYTIYIYTVYVQTTGYRYTSVLPHETCSMMEHDQLKIEKKIRQNAEENGVRQKEDFY